MASLYSGLDVFCQSEARFPEFDAVYTPVKRRSCVSTSRTLAANRQITASPKYNDDVSLVIYKYLVIIGFNVGTTHKDIRNNTVHGEQ